MSLRFYQRTNEGAIAEMPRRVLRSDVELVVEAEEGEVGSCTIPVDDPNMTFAIRGLRKVYAVIDTIDAGADISAGVIGVWYTAERESQRKNYRTGGGRVIDMSMQDLNSVLARKFFTTTTKRPKETDLERIAWLMGQHVFDLVDDDSLVSTTGAVQMDAADYTKQSAFEVLSDCSQQSGKDFFVFNLKQTPDADGDPCLFSLYYDFTESTTLESDLRISNVDEDEDADTFLASLDTTLKIDPAQVYSECIVDYLGGFLTVRRTQTATDFALGGRTTTFAAPNTKDPAIARARGLRYLNSLATEQHIVNTAIQVQGADVNRAQAGMRVQFKLSFEADHGYGDFVWMRILNRTVRQLARDRFEIAMEMTRDLPSTEVTDSEAAGAYAILYQPKAPVLEDSYTHWGSTGPEPSPGYALVPNVGLVEFIEQAVTPESNFAGIRILGTGTVDVEFVCDCAFVTGSLITVTFAIFLNGTIVASQPVPIGGSLAYYSADANVTAVGLAVVPGDEIKAAVIRPAWVAPFVVPAGAGNGSYHLAVIDGDLS